MTVVIWRSLRTVADGGFFHTERCLKRHRLTESFLEGCLVTEGIELEC